MVLPRTPIGAEHQGAAILAEPDHALHVQGIRSRCAEYRRQMSSHAEVLLGGVEAKKGT